MSAFRLRRRSAGISARRMAVRPAVPWYWRIAQTAAGVGAIVLVAWGALALFSDRWGHADAERHIERMEQELRRQQSELAELRSKVAQTDRQVQIDRAAAADLMKHVKSLTFENAQLKEDLAFFQSLMSSTQGREAAISVNRFRLQPEPAAGEYRYRMLLVQSGQRMREFQGKLEFVLDVQHDSRRLILVFPPETDRESRDYQLNFKFFQRVEGSFKLTPGSVLKGMQVRVFENGVRTPKLTQTLDIS